MSQICVMCDRPRKSGKKHGGKSRFCSDTCRDQYVAAREESGMTLLCGALGATREVVSKTTAKYGFAPFLCLLNETHSFSDKTLKWEPR